MILNFPCIGGCLRIKCSKLCLKKNAIDRGKIFKSSRCTLCVLWNFEPQAVRWTGWEWRCVVDRLFAYFLFILYRRLIQKKYDLFMWRMFYTLIVSMQLVVCCHGCLQYILLYSWPQILIRYMRHPSYHQCPFFTVKKLGNITKAQKKLFSWLWIQPNPVYINSSPVTSSSLPSPIPHAPSA